MTQTILYQCARCNQAANAPEGSAPAGWELVDMMPTCGDCAVDLAKSLATEGAIDAGPGQRCETAIALLSGSYLDLADPDCSVIQPIDVAAGLRQPRFCGQTRQFYTIAQHLSLIHI